MFKVKESNMICLSFVWETWETSSDRSSEWRHDFVCVIMLVTLTLIFLMFWLLISVWRYLQQSLEQDDPRIRIFYIFA